VDASTPTDSGAVDASLPDGCVSADAFIFDGETKTVTKNGTAVDFTGSFLTLAVGANLVSTTVTGTSFSLDMTSKYRATYL
jgi:hypothetical protein